MKPKSPLARTAEVPAAAAATGLSDEELMARFCQGDARAFDALFQRYARPIHGYLTRVTGQAAAAEDLSQQTFLSLVKARGRFQPGARVRPWLYAIATNAAHDWRRRKHPEELTDEGELPAHLVSEARGPRDVGLENAVQRALAQLPEGQRIPIVLHRFEGLGFAEIAESLGLTESAVKVRAHRGYARLRELLAALEQETRE